jgi:hypothetical protein
MPLKSPYWFQALARRVRLCVAGTVAFSAVVPSFAESGAPQNAAGIAPALRRAALEPRLLVV